MMDWRHIQVLVVCWLAYSATYFLRKPLGVGKNAMGEALHLSATSLGLLDTCMLVPYAIVQTFYGWIGDIYSPRVTIAVILFASATSMVTVGMISQLWGVLILILINGAVQSLAWGVCVKALGQTFEDESTGNKVCSHYAAPT